MNSPSDQQRHPWLRVPDLIAINVIVLIAAGAAVVSMIESYTNLLDFAENHHYYGWRADIAPGSVDSFILIGEALLFVAVYRGWNAYREMGKFKVPAAMTLAGWALTLFGFTLSVLGNLCHLNTADPITRLMSGVFPVSATVGMAAVLMIIKRVVKDHQAKIAARADIRPHGELLYMLGGFPKPLVAEPVPVPVAAPKRKRQPAVTAAEPQPALPAPEIPFRPRAVPDPDPRPGQVSRPIQMTDAIWRDLEAGMSAAELTARHSELGTKHRVKAIVDAYAAGTLIPGTSENVDGAPVEWLGGPESGVASNDG